MYDITCWPRRLALGCSGAMLSDEYLGDDALGVALGDLADLGEKQVRLETW